MKCKITIVLLLSLFGLLSNAQKSQLKQANLYFAAGKYAQALNSYKNYKNPIQDPQILIKRGICYLKTNQPDECISDMASAHQFKSMDNFRYKYSAQAYFAKGDYVEAARFYKIFLNTLKQNTEDWNKTILEIKKCGFAKNKKYQPQIAFVENLGGNVNTEYDEFCPTQSPTKVGRYYFSSARSESTGGLRNKNGLSDVINGNFYSDIYYVDLKNGNWTTVLPFDNLLNTSKHEIIQDFSNDGSIIYYTKGNDHLTSELYTDTFKIDKNLNALPYPVTTLPFDAKAGDKDLHFFNDSLILFASNRSGGLGAYDIYYAVKSKEVWSEAINFGPTINTEYNEVSPYLIKNSKYLYFSTDRMETLGGYDVFRAEYTNNSWNECSNLFAPINSPADDLDFEISSDGTSAIFTSNRIASKGGTDLYIAYFKEQILGQLEYTETALFAQNLDTTNMLVSDTSKIIISETNKPNEIEPIEKEFACKPLFFTSDDDILNNTNLNQLKRISELMLIYPKSKISLYSHYISEGRPEADLYFSVKRAEKVAEQLQKNGIDLSRIILYGCGPNFPFASNFVNNIPSSLAEKINKRIDYDIISEDESVKINLIYDLPVLAEQFRDSKWDSFSAKNKGVIFKVQFAEVSQMLKSDVIASYPDIIIEKRADQAKYIYTTGVFQTFNEAKKIKDKLMADLYISDSTIIPYHNGFKINLSEAETLKSEYPQLNFILKN